MRILIDLQGAQTASRYRGIGRYSLSLTREIIHQAAGIEFFILLNGNLDESIDQLKEEFKDLLPANHIKIWFGPDVSDTKKTNHAWNLKVANQIRGFYISSLRPDIVLISSFFEGFRDNAVVSIGQMPSTIPTAIIFYDLIPHLNPKEYLQKSLEYQKFYKNKLESLSDADLFLCISKSSAAELGSVIDDHSKIATISCGVDPVFTKHDPRHEEADLFTKFGIASPFIFYSGGVDYRKNLARLLEAYFNLSKNLQEQFQLVIAGKFSNEERLSILENISKKNITSDRLVFTGYVSDHDLALLYGQCAVFVLPSIHEGFGMPALEAMACGAPVIGSNTTSIPEVIELEAALFDPFSVHSIQEKLTQVLLDEKFREGLSAHGIEQAKKFTWQLSAKRALKALETLYLKSKGINQPAIMKRVINRPSLALVSPLPPDRTGIAEYTAQLIPELSKIYDLQIVVTQSNVSLELNHDADVSIRDIQWFLRHGHEMDFVIYQFGNSMFHHHMLSLMELIPGVVVLHDFFVSDLLYYLEHQSLDLFKWTQALYFSHGYAAVRERYQSTEPQNLKSQFPANLQILEAATGIIVHNQWTKKLAAQWYGEDYTKDWQVVPLVRQKRTALGRTVSRQQLGLAQDDYIVCSFGFLDATKLNDVLIKSWLHTNFSKNKSCKLIFVGQNEGGEYGRSIRQLIADETKDDQIFITDWTDEFTYHCYLEAADCAVQLRFNSRGETSAATLDCLAYGLPTIVNAHGSMADLPPEVVVQLADGFLSHELTAALNLLKSDPELRGRLSSQAQLYIEHHHSPKICSAAYQHRLNSHYQSSNQTIFNLLKSLQNVGPPPNDLDAKVVAQSIAQTFPLARPQKQLLLDITATYYSDLHTGIERTARALMNAFVNLPNHEYRAEPVYLNQEKNIWQYQYARKYTLSAMQCPTNAFSDDVVEAQEGDILIVLDLAGHRLKMADQSGLLENYRQRGIKIYFLLYDLLPLQLPHCFPQGAIDAYQEWLTIALKNHGLFCISSAVADDVNKMIHNQEIQFHGLVQPFRLGSDLLASVPSQGIPKDADFFLEQLGSSINFLMVGTIEPRKCYLQAIDALSLIWQDKVKVNLIIVGKEGWQSLPRNERKQIIATVKKMTTHPEFNQRLFWIHNASDEYLQRIYEQCHCLIAASEGEGFGLPIAEAARLGVSVIARDIAVFREVAGDGALYFQGETGEQLAQTIRNWCALFQLGMQPVPSIQSQHTWSDSAKEIYQYLH